MPEILVNTHMHTRYSDGSGIHQDLVRAALDAGLDAFIVTDHNVWIDGLEGYHQQGDRRVLMLIGEEVHDRSITTQKNHLLVFNTHAELSSLAPEPQRLLDGVAQAGGLAFLAHPFEKAAPVIGEADIPWQDWDVQGFTGIELWNGLSEMKGLIKSKFHALFYILNFSRIARGPYPATLAKWDALLAQKQRVVAIGGSDAHALKQRLGGRVLTVFPYEKHFRAINNHLILPQPLKGDVIEDKQAIFDAFRKGHLFIGYDWPASTRGFNFMAQGMEKSVGMGDEIATQGGVTLQVRLPKLPSQQYAECCLLKDGAVIKVWRKNENCTHIATDPGVYRVEVYLPYRGRRRGWIFSNPIYLKG
ncbi:MAG: CehA/McbA family metallohydrolase [Chloroflexota bacterium]